MHKVIIFFLALLLINSSAQTVQAADDVDNQLIYRTASGSAADVSLLLQQGANPNARNSIGRPVIVIAAGRNHPDSAKIVQSLTEKGADPAIYDSLGENAFTSAIATGTKETLSYLLQWKPSYRMTNGFGEDLLAIAKKRQNADIYTMIEQLKSAEIEDWTKKTSGQNRQKLIKDFAYKTCTEEYVLFYYSDQEEELADPDAYDQKMLKIAKDINSTLADLKKYFGLSRASLDGVETLSRKSISNQLSEMGSSNYRKRAGVGTDADLKKRCGKIATEIVRRTGIKRKAQ